MFFPWRAIHSQSFHEQLVGRGPQAVADTGFPSEFLHSLATYLLFPHQCFNSNSKGPNPPFSSHNSRSCFSLVCGALSPITHSKSSLSRFPPFSLIPVFPKPPQDASCTVSPSPRWDHCRGLMWPRVLSLLHAILFSRCGPEPCLPFQELPYSPQPQIPDACI